MLGGRTLVLCVDRDDDIGFKGNLDSPIVGRAACIEAANILALTDPEDSDINAIFQGVKIYDELTEKGEDMVIAILSGDHMHMLDGDRRIAAGLDQVIGATGATSCILVTDGAEDEYVLPIIQSRIPVSSIRRVIVSQMPNLEGTYYIIKKIFDDPKVSRMVFVPIGLAMLLFAIAYFVGNPQYAIVAVVGVLGIYLLIKGIGLDEVFRYFVTTLQISFHRGRLTFVTYISAILLATMGIIVGLLTLIAFYTADPSSGLLTFGVMFVYGGIGWFTVAGLIASGGKIIDTYMTEWESFGRVVVLPFFMTAIGIIAYGASVYILSVSDITDFPYSSVEGNQFILFATISGLLCALFGIYLQMVINKRIVQQARVIGKEGA